MEQKWNGNKNEIEIKIKREREIKNKCRYYEMKKK